MRKLCAILVSLQALVAACGAISVVTVPSGNLVAIEGDRNVNLLCKVPGGQPIDFCIVKVPGVRAPFASSDRLPAPVAGITFYGEGWSKGSCGVTLDTIKPEHDGTFECTVSIKGQSYKGTIEIMVQGEVAPEPPVIEISSNVDGSNGEFDYGKPLIARCISRKGWPGARLSWYLDGAKVAGDQLGAAFSETKDRRTTVQQFFRKPVAVEDNRKQLVCRAEHPKYPQGYVEVALPIKLRKSSNSDNNEIKVDSKISKVQPSAPQLIVSSDISSLKAGSNLVVECISRDGQPAASFLWFLDDQLIYEGLSTPFLSKDSRGSITVQQVLQRTLTAADNGKALICKARHPSGVQETRLRLTLS